MNFIYANLQISPWNIYCTQKNPDLSVPGNIYMDKKEWFNSFSPPFYEPNEGSDIASLKQWVDVGNNFLDYKDGTLEKIEYFNKNSEKFTENNIRETLIRVDNQFREFFKIDSQIYQTIPQPRELISLLAEAHFGINFADLYFFPIEALVTRKLEGVDFLNSILTKEKQAEVVNKTFSIESVVLPMAVLHKTKRVPSQKYLDVFFKLCESLYSTEEEIKGMLDVLEKKFSASRYMDVKFAQKIVESNAEKIIAEKYFNLEEFVAYKVQNLCGAITWSKYIPIQKEAQIFHTYIFTDLLHKIVSCDEVYEDKELLHKMKLETASGAEKHAKLIYLVDHFFRSNPSLKEKVLNQSKAISKIIFSKIVNGNSK